MPIIKRILFPFDFSEQGSHAAPFVSAIANRFGATVTLLSVLPPVWDFPTLGMPVVTSGDQTMEGELKSRLDAAPMKELDGIAVDRVTTSGDPAFRIADFADANSVDLIMMATHGTGLFRSLLIGSVTAKVLHDAKCPVWTATHAEEQRSPATPRTILCAVDGTSDTPALIRWAIEFAQRMGAGLKLLHVVPPLSDWLTLPSERELQEQVREEARAKINSLARSAGFEGTVRVAVGQIADTVTEEARQEGADLIVIGRGTLPSALGRVRSHTYGIIQQSPCPVLSI
ncbi:MAG TPA: universal stress protein [Bryobacteraceae bacterium]|jgi:nucleotide-binding universal stress UspA family protein